MQLLLGFFRWLFYKPMEATTNDAQPFIPTGLFVEEHQKRGKFSFDPSKIELYLSKEQENNSMNGNGLRKELKGKPVLNACILDYLLAHQELIPDSWKGKNIFFFGTVYRDSDGSLFVRCLSWNGSEWCSYLSWLVSRFYSNYHAILAVS